MLVHVNHRFWSHLGCSLANHHLSLAIKTSFRVAPEEINNTKCGHSCLTCFMVVSFRAGVDTGF